MRAKHNAKDKSTEAVQLGHIEHIEQAPETSVTADTAKTCCTRGRPRTFCVEQALNKALYVFWQHGYEHASMSMLCKEMGLTAPSVYAAFGSKAELFCKAVDAYEAQYWDQARAKFHAEPSAVRAIHDYFEYACETITCSDCPCGCMVVFSTLNAKAKAEDQCVTQKIEDLLQALYDMFASKIQQGISSGELRADCDVEALTTILCTIINGFTLQVHNGITKEQLLRALTQVDVILEHAKA